MRSRCHQRPLYFHAGVRSISAGPAGTGFGHSASTAAMTAAASSGVGAGEIVGSVTSRTLRERRSGEPAGQADTTEVPATLSCQVCLSPSQIIHR